MKHILLIKKMNFVQENNHVLYIWNGTISGDIEQEVNQLKAIPNVQVNVENADRVLLGENFVLQKIILVVNVLNIDFSWLRTIAV